MTLMPDPNYDPDEPFDFDDDAAGKVSNWERLLADAGAKGDADMAAMEGMDEDQLTYLGSLTYEGYEPAKPEPTED